MFYSSALLAVTALTGLVAAQTGQTIDPNSVPIATRDGWCDAERNTCPLICGDAGTTANVCDPTGLTYSCLCRGNTQPNISDYTQTLPFFICQTSIAQCIAANTNSAQAQAACQAVTCGNKNATGDSATTSSGSGSGSSSQTGAASSSTTAASSTSASGSASSTSASASATASKSSAGMAVTMARDYGTHALVVGLLAAFGLAI